MAAANVAFGLASDSDWEESVTPTNSGSLTSNQDEAFGQKLTNQKALPFKVTSRSRSQSASAVEEAERRQTEAKLAKGLRGIGDSFNVRGDSEVSDVTALPLSSRRRSSLQTDSLMIQSAESQSASRSGRSGSGSRIGQLVGRLIKTLSGADIADNSSDSRCHGDGEFSN